MRVHRLKCQPEEFDAIWRGAKTFEVRINDRGYETGDTLVLRELADAGPSLYTGREIDAFVPFITGHRAPWAVYLTGSHQSGNAVVMSLDVREKRTEPAT